MKNRKLVLALCACLAVAPMAFAHPPSDIEIQFASETKTLTAVITHRVGNPGAHFINKIDIGVNGEEVTSLSFTAQENGRQQTVSVPLPQVKSGDSLSVEAYCNLSGKLEKKINAA